MKRKILQFGGASVLASLLLLCASARAQVNSGSNGGDGALDFSSLTNLGYSTNIVIDMHDHSNGIYQYTSVNIPANVTVTFIPNANNSPVTWLVQSNALINGTINVSGQDENGAIGGIGGPGGWSGGSGGSNPSSGQGPGGGNYYDATHAGGGSYGSQGTPPGGAAPGSVYGNSFLLPLLGGSGGAGCSISGGGGGGAILIAASNSIVLNGQIIATGGVGWYVIGYSASGSGSGGGIRLIATLFTGNGAINANGGGYNITGPYVGGNGRVRIDALENTFGGTFAGGVVSQGFQPIIIQTNGQGIQLAIATVGGAAVSANPTGQFITPDTLIPGSATNPIPVVVSCQNLPLNTPVTVTLDPANGPSVSAIGTNNVGTLASSTATVSLVIPRGGGIIYATATAGN
jgi:hypothetical protein